MIESIAEAALLAATLFANKALEEAGKKAGSTVSAAAGRVVTWLRRTGAADPRVGSALAAVEAAPEDAAVIQTLGTVVVDHVRGDNAREAELLGLAEECRKAGHVTMIGGTHVHGDVSGGTITQYGGDHIEFRR